jgi:hypothetical protein
MPVLDSEGRDLDTAVLVNNPVMRELVDVAGHARRGQMLLLLSALNVADVGAGETVHKCFGTDGADDAHRLRAVRERGW